MTLVVATKNSWPHNIIEKHNLQKDCVNVPRHKIEKCIATNLQQLESGAGDVMLLEVYDALTAEEKKKLCFSGRLISKDADPGFLPIEFVYEQPRQASKMSFKDFQKAKANGSIVFQKHLASRFRAIYQPGYLVPSGTPGNPGFRQQDFALKYGFTEVPHACSLNNLRIVSQNLDWYMVPFAATYSFRTDTRRFQGNTAVPWVEFNERGLRSKAFDIVALATSGLSVDRGLVTSVRSEANSGTFDLLTELAEFPETVKWIYGLLKEIISLFRRAKKDVSFLKQHAPKKDLADKITGRWMEYRYAVTPLTHSVADAMSLLSHDIVKFQSYRQGFTERKTFSLNGEEISLNVVHRCVIKHSFGMDGMRLQDMLKTNLLSTAWELVPLSWAVDWALNIGNLLSALQLPSNVSQEAACYSWRINEPIRVPTENNGFILVNLDFYKRTPIEPLTHIGLDFSPLMNMKRSLDTMSLAWQMFIRKRV